MAHDLHDPVVTVDADDNYIKTTCRECGVQLDDEIAEVEMTPAQKAARTRAANKAAAEAAAEESADANSDAADAADIEEAAEDEVEETVDEVGG